MSQWYYPKGSLRRGPWEAVVDESLPGWQFTGMRLADSADAGVFEIAPDGKERVIYMLSGESTEVTYTVSGVTETVTLQGRKSVFHGAVDYLYLPIDTDISFTTNGRVMVVEAVASTPKPVNLRRAADVPLLLRGAGK